MKLTQLLSLIVFTTFLTNRSSFLFKVGCSTYLYVTFLWLKAFISLAQPQTKCKWIEAMKINKYKPDDNVIFGAILVLQLSNVVTNDQWLICYYYSFYVLENLNNFLFIILNIYFSYILFIVTIQINETRLNYLCLFETRCVAGNRRYWDFVLWLLWLPINQFHRKKKNFHEQ